MTRFRILKKEDRAFKTLYWGNSYCWTVHAEGAFLFENIQVIPRGATHVETVTVKVISRRKL